MRSESRIAPRHSLSARCSRPAAGQDFIKKVNQGANDRLFGAEPAPPVPPTPLPAPTVTAPPDAADAAPKAAAEAAQAAGEAVSSSEAMAQQLQQLQQQLRDLQQLSAEGIGSATEKLTSSLSPLPPAYAAEPPELPRAVLTIVDLDATPAVDVAAGLGGAVQSLTPSLLDSAAFEAIADGGFGSGGGFWLPLVMGLVRSSRTAVTALTVSL